MSAKRPMRTRVSSRAGTARPPRGVALIEVLVAVLIFSLGILGLIGLQARAISFSTDAEDRNRAAMLANELATVMWVNNSLNVPAATLTAWQARVAGSPSSGLPNGAGNVAITGNEADITITWRATSRTSADSDSRLVTKVVLP